MNRIFLFSLVGATLILSGCGNTNIKEKLGLDRHSPDEFSVMQRAPLEIPSDLTSLPIPQPGMARPQDVTAKKQAEQVILGNVGGIESGNEKPSSSEEALLQKTNSGGGNQNIRRQLAEESTQSKNDKRPVIKRLLSIGDGDSSAVVVDAKAEAKRIQNTKAAGKPVTTGDTPVIEE